MQGNLVTASAKELRALSRWSLKDCWGVAILASILCEVVIYVPAAILAFVLGEESWANISGVYSLLMTAPLSLGMTMFYLNIFRKRSASPVEIFYGFEFIFKAVLLQIIMGILIFLQTLLFIIPGIIAAYRYSMAFFILSDDPTKGVMQCIRESKFLMMGNKMSLFLLELSFFGWILLAIAPMFLAALRIPEAEPFSFSITFIIAFLISVIGLCVLQPYMQVAQVAFYEMASGRLKVKRTETYAGSGYAQGFDTTQNMGPQASYQGQPQGEPQAQHQSQPQLWPQGEQQAQPQNESQNDGSNDGDTFQN